MLVYEDNFVLPETNKKDFQFSPPEPSLTNILRALILNISDNLRNASIAFCELEPQLNKFAVKAQPLVLSPTPGGNRKIQMMFTVIKDPLTSIVKQVENARQGILASIELLQNQYEW